MVKKFISMGSAYDSMIQAERITAERANPGWPVLELEVDRSGPTEIHDVKIIQIHGRVPKPKKRYASVYPDLLTSRPKHATAYEAIAASAMAIGAFEYTFEDEKLSNIRFIAREDV